MTLRDVAEEHAQREMYVDETDFASGAEWAADWIVAITEAFQALQWSVGERQAREYRVEFERWKAAGGLEEMRKQIMK